MANSQKLCIIRPEETFFKSGDAMETLISEDYIPGAYKRKELKDYLQFFQFMNSNIQVDKTRGRKIVNDSDARWWLNKGYISCESYERYVSELIEFMDFERLSDFTDEQIVFEVEKIRLSCLTDRERENVYRERDVLLKNFLQAFLAVGFPKSKDRWFKRRIPMGEARYIASQIHSGTKQKLDKLTVQSRKEDYLFNLEELQMVVSEVIKKRKIKIFASDFIFLRMFLSELDGRFGTEDHLDCTIILKEKPMYRDPRETDFADERYKDIDIRIKRCSAENAGYDLRDRAVQRELRDEEALVLVIGENAGMTFEGFKRPYWLLAVLETDKFCKYLGVLPSFEKREKRVFIRKILPQWSYPFKKRFNGMEHSTFNINSGVCTNRSHFMNMFSMSYDPGNFPEFGISSDTWEDIIGERKHHLMERLDAYGLKYRCFHLKHADGDPVRLDVINLGKEKKIEPYLAQDYDQSLINIRDFKTVLTDDSKPFLFINFLYFATQKLVNLYNAQRSSRERLDFNNFYIDSIYNKAKSITTLPLYNKGFVGLKDGKLQFGTESLGSGSMAINDFEFEWSEFLINSMNTQYKPVLFTPTFFQEHSEKFPELLKDRINAIIVNDRLIAVRKGEVKMPSFGVILSLPVAFEGEIKNRMKLTEDQDGFYKMESGNKVLMQLEQNEGYTWKYGGGTLLVKEGVNLVKDEATARATFTEEGWYNPLSMETQETQVQDWVRGPRSVIGEDMDGNVFFGVFSGRTKESSGARFDEVVEIIENKFCGIRHLLNLDGGASSCLGLIYKREFFELSLPCATNFTCTGMVRPVNSFLLADI